MSRLTARKIAFCGILAAVYAAVTVATASFSYGPIQLRLAEALSVLCCFEPTAVIGITLGCFLANLFSVVSPLDLLFGTVASLLACLCMTKWRKPWQTVLPNVLLNGVLIGSELALTTVPLPLFWSAMVTNGLSVALGEAAVMLVLGFPLYHYLRRSAILTKIFHL